MTYKYEWDLSLIPCMLYYTRFDSTTRLRFSLLWHISVMKQDSYASLFQLGGKDFTAQLQVCPHTTSDQPWAILGLWFPTLRQSHLDEYCSVKPMQTFMVLLLLHWRSLMWPVAWGHDRLYDFKTIDRGGVCQSHHQGLIGSRVPFLITTVTRTLGVDLKSKKCCQCVSRGVMTAKKQTVQVWLIGEKKGCFLNSGCASPSCFQNVKQKQKRSGTEFHHLLFWVTWSQPEVAGKTQMADHTRLIPCTPHSHDPRETTSTQNQSHAHSVGCLEPV